MTSSPSPARGQYEPAFGRDSGSVVVPCLASYSADSASTVSSSRGILTLREFVRRRVVPEFLLRTELRQPNTYFSVLRALAHGRRKPNEIAGMAGVDSSSLSTYLQKLRRLRLVERHIPVTASPTSSKRGRYRLSAPLFRFWFRFVYGRQDRLRTLGEDAYEEIVAPDFADYVSPLSRFFVSKSSLNSSIGGFSM